MDELELLKRDWKKRDQDFNPISEQKIYGMLHKSSSSIVKWIFIISIIEFLVFRLFDISLFYDENLIHKLESYHIYDFEKAATLFNFIILGVFIYSFYQKLKTISAISNTKKLMQDILQTRKIVKYYVMYNLIMVGTTAIVLFYCQFIYEPEIAQYSKKYFWPLIGLFSVVTITIVAFMYLIYRLIYGRLNRRLHNNYKELKKIEV